MLQQVSDVNNILAQRTPESPRPVRTPESPLWRWPRRKTLMELLEPAPEPPRVLRTSWAKMLRELMTPPPPPVPVPVPEPPWDMLETTMESQEVMHGSPPPDPETLPRRIRFFAPVAPEPEPLVPEPLVPEPPEEGRVTRSRTRRTASLFGKREKLQYDADGIVLKSDGIRALIMDRTPLLTKRRFRPAADADAVPQWARQLPLMYTAGMPPLPRSLESFYVELALSLLRKK